MKGGAFILKRLFGGPGKGQVSDVVRDKRLAKQKNVKEFLRMVKDKKVRVEDYDKVNDYGIKGVPKNLSKGDECKGKKLNVTIERKNNKFAKFLKEYDEFNKYYNNERTKLSKFLEQTVLKKDTTGLFSIKKFNLKQLNDIEKNVRGMLVVYYTECHKRFIKTFAELSNAILT